MRTTVTLDPDVQLLVKRLMEERGLTFKGALNEAFRRGLAPPAAPAMSPTVPRHLGRPAIDLTRALAVAGQLEDDALAARQADGR